MKNRSERNCERGWADGKARGGRIFDGIYVTDEQRRQRPRPAARSPEIFFKQALKPAGLLLLLGFAVAARAGLPPSGKAGFALEDRQKLTLAEIKRLAFERNWDLLAARSDVDLATAQRIVAGEFPNPTVSLSTQKIGTDGQTTSTAFGNDIWHRNYDTILAVNQLLEIGGKRSSRKSSAAAGIAGAKARLADARRVLDLAVTKAYVAVLLAEANVEILNQSAASLRQEAKIAETRLKAGDISEADKSQIEIAADRLELDARSAANAAAAARVAVEVLIGVENPKGIWVPGDSLTELAVSSARASTLLPGALPLPRPDLLAAEADVRKADADVHLQKAMRIPDPTVLVQYEHEPPDQPNTIGLGVSFPLPLWNRNGGAIKAAESTREQAAIQKEKLRGQISAEVLTAELAYEDAAARFHRYDEQIRPNSEKVRQTVAFAYQKGGASLLDLLSAERTDNDIRLATAQAKADSANAAMNLAAARNLLSQTEPTSLDHVPQR